MTKRSSLLLLALLAGALFFTATAFVAEASSSGADLIVEKTKQVTEIVVGIVRSIAVAVALISLVFLGLKFFSGGLQAMVEAKHALIALVIALFIIFNGETIVGLIVKAVK